MKNSIHPIMAQALRPFMPPAPSRQRADFHTRISGIPCLIRVGRVDIIKGTYSSSASCPDEFYGSSEIEFNVLDCRGYRAPWLEKKLTPADVARIEAEIITEVQA